MVNKGMSIPIYIATQNTQLSFSNLYENLSLVGEELWGFVRSVNIELIYGVITMIDLQPSLSETISTLLNFVSSSCRNPETVNTEIIIFKNKTYGAQFTKVPRKNVLPKLRNEVALLEKSMSPHKILTDRSIKVGTLYACESSGEEYRRKNDTLLLKLNLVCVHPVCIYPRTSSGIDLDQDIWKDTIKDGHELLGIEYTGYKLYRVKKGKSFCTEPKVDDEIKNDFSNRWEIVCIYPSKLLTEMNIPADCTVLLKDLKVYIPGLLLYTVISFRLCEFVPRGSKVVIQNNDEPTSGNFLLTCILQTCKSCKVISENMNVGNSAGIDYLVSIDQIDESCVAVGKCKSIICIDGCIKGSLRMKISRSKDQRLTCLSVAHLLERKHISKCLPKAVDWIQQNVHKVSKMQYSKSMHNDQKCCIPCPTTDIVSNGRLLLPIRKPLQSLFNKSSVYIVTGGMTGLGWELAVLLAEMGAGTIATFSRRKIPEEKLTQIEEIMKKTGCKIFGIQADVTKLESVENAISEAERLSQGNKIQGVFHCAGVLEGKLLTQLEKSQLDYVLRPKVIGTLNMHIATMKHKLHYFVVSSSINSLIGSPGQASYGAANCFLDTFIDWRRSQGLTGQSINWGALAIGMAARPEFTDNFEKRGFNLLSVSDIRSCFQDALMGNLTKTIYTDVNWNMHAKDYDNPYMKRFRIRMSVFLEQEITELRQQSSDANHLYIDQPKLQNSSKAAQIEAITQVILNITGKVIWQNFHQLDSSTALADLSLDSMSSVTFINIVQDVTGYRISPTFLLNTNNTLKDVVLLLQEKMFNRKHTNDLKKTTESNTYL
jgi:NAD(P)-dependent dehydrogenase (short-subunit alcohol dehydrogenase family)/acyl carrier protein